MNCTYAEASERPASSAAVFLQYRSDSAHQDLDISLYAPSQRGPVYDELIRGDGWKRVVSDGQAIHVTKAGFQTQAWLERDGTFAFLMSETLSPDEITKIAASFTPAPAISDV